MYLHITLALCECRHMKTHLLNGTIDNEPMCLCVCITTSSYERQNITFIFLGPIACECTIYYTNSRHTGCGTQIMKKHGFCSSDERDLAGPNWYLITECHGLEVSISSSYSGDAGLRLFYSVRRGKFQDSTLS